MEGENELAIWGGEAVSPRRKGEWPEVGEAEVEAVAEVLRSGRWGGRLAVESHEPREFADCFARLQGGPFAIPVTTDTAALELALTAAGIGRGDEVIVPALTSPSTPAAVLAANAVPVFADVLRGTHCIDPAAVEAALTHTTAAIVAGHGYGSMAALDVLPAIASRHGLALVEDCRHAVGATWLRRGAGTFGEFGSFSFRVDEPLTAGEGGAILTRTPWQADLLESLASCGFAPHHRRAAGPVAVQSGCHRMPALQATVLRMQLARFPEQRARRLAARAALDELLDATEGVRPLERQEAVDSPPASRYVLRLEPGAFAGTGIDEVGYTLRAELRCEVERVPGPVCESGRYLPHTARRLRLDAYYWKAIDPERFAGRFPAAREVHRESLAIHHRFLLRPSAAAELEAALFKLRLHASRLATGLPN